MNIRAMPKLRDIVPTLIVSQHPVAVAYLMQQLARDPLIVAQPVNQLGLSNGYVQQQPLVILDSCGLQLLPSECMHQLHRHASNLRCVVLDYSFELRTICQLLALGVHGFVMYEEVPESLCAAVHSVYHGGTWMDAAILRKFVGLAKLSGSCPDRPGNDEQLAVWEHEIATS